MLDPKKRTEVLRKTVLENPYIPHVPTEKQAKALTSPTKEMLFGGAAGGGKSDWLLMAALQFVQFSDSYHAIIFRRTHQDLKLEGALIPRSREWLTDTDATWNGQDKKWTFPSGSTLSFGYLRHEKHKYRYQSSEFQFIGFDELTQFQESQYTYLFSRLRRTENDPVPIRMRSASNPGNRGHQWVKDRFLTQDTTDKKRMFIPSYIDDNPHLDTDEYKESLEELDDEKIEQLLEGDWDSFSGAYFGDLWKKAKHVIPPVRDVLDLVEEGSFRIDRSYDWGSSKPSACIWWLECGGEEIELRDGSTITPPPGSLIGLNEFYTWNGTPNEGNRMLAEEQGRKIAEFEDAREWPVEKGPADASIFDVEDGDSIAEEMEKHDIGWVPADKSPGSRMNGAQKVRSMLSAAKNRDHDNEWLLFTENCRHCIRTLPTLPSDDRNPDDVDTDAEDHAYDAIRYRTMYEPKIKEAKQVSVGGL